jgi:hypothetical protein
MAIPQGGCSSFAFTWDLQFGSALRTEMIYRDAFQNNHILNAFRPWWASQWYLAETERPIDIGKTLVFLSITSVLGLGLLIVSSRNWKKRTAGFISAVSLNRTGGINSAARQVIG